MKFIFNVPFRNYGYPNMNDSEKLLKNEVTEYQNGQIWVIEELRERLGKENQGEGK